MDVVLHSTDARIPLLNGVRGVAIALVFATHAGVAWIPGGFGVTAFFFISGYLITTLLRIEFEKSGKIAFKAYYLRRALRLWPPLYVFLAISILLWAIGLNPWLPHCGPLLASAIHFSNYYEIFGRNALLPGHEVLWSLAVEEHFYLLYPALLWLTLKIDPSRKLAVSAGWVLCAATLCWRLWLVAHGSIPWRTYKATDTRIDSIVYGCLLGCWKNPCIDKIQTRSVERILLLIAGALVLLVSLVPRDIAFRETFRYSLQGCGLLAVFSAALQMPSHWTVCWLDSRPLVWIGGLSYSIYLFHYTALAVTRHYLDGPLSVSFISLTTTLLLAVILHHWVERPCAILRRRLHRNLTA